LGNDSTTRIQEEAWGGCNGNAKKSYRENQGKTQEGRGQGIDAQKDHDGQKNQDNQQKGKEERAASRRITQKSQANRRQADSGQADADSPAKPAAPEERIGVVTHYYSHPSVAAIQLERGTLRVGDVIHICGHTTDFRQKVESLEVDHAPATEVGRRTISA
jgi:hypothetical protein